MPELTRRQNEALCMGKSLCVTAGAGTGKTFLVSKRYRKLLSHLREQDGGGSVLKILALTFTEKAAAEMRGRIGADIRALAAKAEDADEYRFWTGVLDEFPRASITTFHGFCAAVLREFALDAQIDPGFEILDEMEKQVMTTTLIKNTLTRPSRELYEDAALLFADLAQPEEVIAEILPKYPEFAQYFPKNPAEQIATVENWRHLMLDAVRLRQSAFFLETNGAAAVAMLGEFSGHICGEGGDSGEKYLCQIRDALPFLTPDAEPEAFLAAVAAVRKANGEKTGAKLGSKKVFGDDLERFRLAFTDLRQAVELVPKNWSSIPGTDDSFTTESIRVITALGNVTGEIWSRYQQEKLQRGTLDFEDLIRMTGKLVRNPAIAQALRRRFSFVLVDEVQDTDPAQSAILWEIIGTLTPATDAVFLVGDPKQSIYAFRNADICEVNAMQERVSAACLTQPVALDISFRSTKEILGVVNTLFSRLFSESAERWDVAYDPISVSDLRRDDVGTVQILETTQDAGTPDTLQEARAIAAKIHEITASALKIRDGCDMRSPQFGDIAILLETRTGQAMIEHALREAGVPYRIYKSQGFYRSREVLDMTLLLSVIAGTGDDIALYGLLRSPYFGISDAELCAAGAGGGGYGGRAARYAREHPNTGVAAALAKLRGWQSHAMREPVPELLRRVLRESGMYAVYGGMANGSSALANLEKLIGIARTQVRKRAVSLPEFVQMLTTGTGEEIAEGEAQIAVPEGDAVQIMTVHASKGLEFPVVILANLDSTSSSPGTGLVLEKNIGVGLAIRMHGSGKDATDTFVKMFTRGMRDAKEIAEKKRLFYVAMTRAKDHLILSYVRVKNFPQNSRAAWISRYLLPQTLVPKFTVQTDDGFPVEITVTSTADAPATKSSRDRSRPEIVAKHTYAVRDAGSTPKRPASSATQLNQQDSQNIRASRETAYGIALHGVFQGRDAAMLCRKYRLGEGAAEGLRRAYAAFQTAPLMQNVDREYCELPFAVEIAGRRFTGIIDRVVRYTDGSWRVIDYKSGAVATADDRRPQYRRQVSLYAAAVERLFGVRPKACIYFPHDGGIWEISPDETELAALFDDS